MGRIKLTPEVQTTSSSGHFDRFDEVFLQVGGGIRVELRVPDHPLTFTARAGLTRISHSSDLPVEVDRNGNCSFSETYGYSFNPIPTDRCFYRPRNDSEETRPPRNIDVDFKGVAGSIELLAGGTWRIASNSSLAPSAGVRLEDAFLNNRWLSNAGRYTSSSLVGGLLLIFHTSTFDASAGISGFLGNSWFNGEQGLQLGASMQMGIRPHFKIQIIPTE